MYATLQRQPTRPDPPAPALGVSGNAAALQAMLARAPRVHALEVQSLQANRGAAIQGVVQGFWPELAIGGGVALGALALGGLGYWLANRNRGGAENEHAPHAAIDPALHQGEREAMVASLLGETDAMEQRPDVDVIADQGRESAATRRHDGTYRVNVNPVHPISSDATDLLGNDPDLLATARMHELTHVSVFEGYGGRNAERESAFNMIDVHDPEERGTLARLYDELSGLLDADPVMQARPEAERQFLHDRLLYQGTAYMSEMDSVLNELVYYLHLKNIPATSAFSRRLVSLARERQNLRAPQFAPGAQE